MATLRIEKDDDQILVAYVKLSEEKIARTVEIERNKILVDEDENGAVVGIELLFPDHISDAVRKISVRYNNPEITKSVDELLAVC